MTHTVNQTIFTPFILDVIGDTAKLNASPGVLQLLGHRPEDVPTSMKVSDFFDHFFSTEAMQKYNEVMATGDPSKSVSIIMSLKKNTETTPGAPICQATIRVLFRTIFT